MAANICILFGGTLCLLMVLFHLRLPKMFGWSDAYRAIPLPNKRIFHTIHIALILLFCIASFLSFAFFRELGSPDRMASAMLILFSAFWLWRALWQLFYFKLPHGAPKKYLRMNCAQTTLFVLLCASYLLPVILSGTGL